MNTQPVTTELEVEHSYNNIASGHEETGSFLKEKTYDMLEKIKGKISTSHTVHSPNDRARGFHYYKEVSRAKYRAESSNTHQNNRLLGTVLRNDDVYVSVELETPRGIVDAALQKIIFPTEVAYGQRFYLWIDSSGGYRRPKIDLVEDSFDQNSQEYEEAKE